jgi:hypothetical protein
MSVRTDLREVHDHNCEAEFNYRSVINSPLLLFSPVIIVRSFRRAEVVGSEANRNFLAQ